MTDTDSKTSETSDGEVAPVESQAARESEAGTANASATETETATETGDPRPGTNRDPGGGRYGFR